MEREWNSGELLQISGGYWQACALHAGVDLDIFTALAEKPLLAKMIAEEVGAEPRATEMLLHALTAMGLLDKRGEEFANTAAAGQYLSRKSDRYLGHIIRHHHHLMAGWAQLPAAVRSGKPVRQGVVQADEERRESFLLGMFNLASQLAPILVPQIDIRGRNRLLDLGGGPGTYAIHFCRHNPQLQAVVYDLPTTRPFAEKTIARLGMADRILFQDGDFLRDGVDGRFDVAWLSHILHGESPEGCARIIARAVAALEPGGMILIHEFILADDMAGPLFPALFSLNMLLATESGQSYSGEQITGMLKAAGVHDIRRLQLDLPGETGVIAGKI
ncbi:MAG: methyltransferase [Desulfuromonadales bacterium]